MVDDEEPVRSGLKKCLETRGHSVSVAADGEEALQSALTERPDLVVTDLQMPKLDGLHFLREARAQGLSSPFVVLIGAEMPSVLSEVSFLTNKTEASLLKQAAHRQRIAQALSDAVIEYQASLKKVTSVAERTAER